MDKREADPEYGADDDDVDVNRTEDADAPDAETEDDVPDVSDDEEDLDDEVSKCMLMHPCPAPLRECIAIHLLTDPALCPGQGNPVVNLAKRAIAKAERERLRQQAKQKKDLLEKMRIEQNSAAQMGEVRWSCLLFVPELLRVDLLRLLWQLICCVLPPNVRDVVIQTPWPPLALLCTSAPNMRGCCGTLRSAQFVSFTPNRTIVPSTGCSFFSDRLRSSSISHPIPLARRPPRTKGKLHDGDCNQHCVVASAQVQTACRPNSQLPRTDNASYTFVPPHCLAHV